ncbi:MAG: site-specific integrase [Sphingobium sp.]|nr:site-specific integrase [Sphingobium sp.]
MPNDRRIDRRIQRPAAAADPVAATAIVIFRDARDASVQRFDPAALGLPPDMVGPLMAAFRLNDAGATLRTRCTRWRALRRFARFLASEDVTSAGQVNAGTMKRYLAFLARPDAEGKRYKRPTIATQLGLIRPLLERAEQADPKLFGAALAIPYNPVPGSRIHDSKPRLPKEDLQAILMACYEEIDAAWAKFQRGQAIIAAPEAPPRAARGESLDSAIWRLHQFTGGIAPTWEQLREAGVAHSRLLRWGWRGGIAEHYHLTTRTVVPFYIALAIQLAANPDPLRLIRRDCLVAHPIDDNRVLVEWLKHKTAPNPKIQRRSFDVRKSRSAPRLIEMLLAMTEPLIPHVPDPDHERLFLVHYLTTSRYRSHDKPAGLIPYATLSAHFGRFIDLTNKRIAEWNRDHPDRPRRALPHFAPGQLRGSVATLHYLASGGDLLATAAILNHRDPVVTDAYVEGPAARWLERETIARLQRMMVAWVTAPEQEETSAPANISGPVTALFGHRCMMPLEANGAGGTRVCRHLGGCLTCPGLIVPLDAEHCARVLQAQRHLLESRDRIDADRWNMFYAPSLRVLEQDLLPAFPVEMLRGAEQQVHRLPTLPDIE